MGSVVQNANRLIANASLDSAWRVVFLAFFVLMIGPVYLHSQCPDNGQTKVIKPNKGTGYYFCGFRKLWHAFSGNYGTLSRPGPYLVQLEMTRTARHPIELDESSPLQNTIQDSSC